MQEKLKNTNFIKENNVSESISFWGVLRSVNLLLSLFVIIFSFIVG